MRSISYLFPRLVFVLLIAAASSEGVEAQTIPPLDFGQARCGTTTCDMLRIPSTATSQSVVSLQLLDGRYFSIGTGLMFPVTIPESDSARIPLCFSPPRRGLFTDTVQVVIRTAGLLDTVMAEIGGTGTGPGFDVDDMRVLFPTTDTGKTGIRNLVIRNNGEEDLPLDLADFADVVAPFSITDSSVFPATIIPGDSLVISLAFRPTRQGHRSILVDVPNGCENVRLLFSGATSSLITKGFGEVACDDILCDTLWIHAEQSAATQILRIRFRDSLSFSVGEDFSFPRTVNAGDSLPIPVCFSPARRGNIIDSIIVTVRRSTGEETVRVRLAGTGIGPFVSIDPLVLNFPRLTPPATAQLSTTLVNSGERPLLVTESNLMIPPPFRLINPLPFELDPGDTVRLDVEFAPTESGIFSVPVNIEVGCNRVLQIGLNGSTDFIGTGGVLRVTKVGFNPANNERVTCDVSQCTDVTLTNVGNAPLLIEEISWHLGTLGFTINPPVVTPFSIGPNQSRVLNVCINAQRAGTLRDTLHIVSNDRRSIAFGIVLDISGSMSEPMLCGANSPRRIDEAVRQAETFIDNTLLYLPAVNIQDQIAVILYSGTNRAPSAPLVTPTYPLTDVTDATRMAARTAVNVSAPSGGTWTGTALDAMIDTLAKSPLPDRVIVLLTDGPPSAGDLSRFPSSRTIARAREENVRIFAIGLGLDGQDAIDYVTDLSRNTDAEEFIASDCGSLQDAFSRITELVSQGGEQEEPFQITVSAPQLIADDILFDSLYIYDDTCVTMTLTNVGEGTAIVDRVDFTDLVGAPTAEFFLKSGTIDFPISIPENGQRDIQVCFRPEKIRERFGLAKAVYNDCFAENATGQLAGVGYAEANLRIDDERITLPGGLISLPVYGDTSLALYEVDSITWSMRWNRTMLDLKGVRPGSESNGAAVVQVGPVVESGNFATVQFRSDGRALDRSGELAILDFEFLRGDTLASYVEITTGQFADDNPHFLVKNAGLVIYDSTCFRELRPISFVGVPAKIAIGSVSPTPSTGDNITVELEATGDIGFDVGLFTTQGEQVIRTEHHELNQGKGILTLDISHLKGGAYYLRVVDDGGTVAYHKLLITR